MNNDKKAIITISIVLFILAFFAWHSISLLPKKQLQIQKPLLPSAQEAVNPMTTEAMPSEGSQPIVSIPTAEEIQLSIEDQNQKRKALEERMATRDKKAGKVIAEAKAAASSQDSQEEISKNTPPQLSPEARAERNKELRDGVKEHRYFPR